MLSYRRFYRQHRTTLGNNISMHISVSQPTVLLVMLLVMLLVCFVWQLVRM